MARKFKLEPEIVVMCGIPGIGKSRIVGNFFPYHQRVNMDSIHELLTPGSFEKRNIGLARDIEEMIINESLSRKTPIIIDNTNVTPEKRERYTEFAKKYSVGIKAVYFEPDAKKAIEQNSKREQKVPKVAIYKMVKDFKIPQRSEGFLEIYNAKEIGRMFGGKPAVFFDRDGVILNNKVNGKDHYVNKIDDIIFYENSLDALKKFSKKGYELFIISNQAGVAKGIMSQEQLEEINANLNDTFAKNKINMREIYCCTHSKEERCKCRKPKTGMIIQAAHTYGLNLGSSCLLGDMSTDIELGNRLDLKTILLETGCAGLDNEYNAIPSFRAKNIYEAVNMIPNLN
jgi:D-glycero-D-manno-heptose 1,7-bisphosphate phosphatase